MPEAPQLTPEILAGDIRRYLRQGVALEQIRQGALQNGISVDLWDRAAALVEPTETDNEVPEVVPKTAPPELERKFKKPSKFEIFWRKNKDSFKIIGLLFLLLTAVFYAYALFTIKDKNPVEIFLSNPFTLFRKPSAAEQYQIIEKREGDMLIVEQPVDFKNPSEPSIIVPIAVVEESQEGSNDPPLEIPDPPPEETVVEDRRPAELGMVPEITDNRFQEKVFSGEILVDKPFPDLTAFDDINPLIAWLTEKYPGFQHISGVRMSFDDTGEVLENEVRFIDQNGYQNILAINTRVPYFIQGGIVYRLSNDPILVSPELSQSNWPSLFEKIMFSTFAKASLQFNAQLYEETPKKFIKATFQYWNSTPGAGIETDFSEFDRPNGEVGIAFGRTPKQSYGKFTEQYPLRRGPAPRTRSPDDG